MIPASGSKAMNKTLSLIEEENEDELYTNEERSRGQLGDSQKIYIEDTLKEFSL